MNYTFPSNGGLFTGEKADGPWGSVPVIPDAVYMTHVNLRSAEPPPGATSQYPGGPRPGNNIQDMPELGILSKQPNTPQIPEPFGPIIKYSSFKAST
jgi:hypothetical protein